MSSCCPPIPPAAPVSEDSKTLAALYKALAHPARVQILNRLVEQGACVCGDLVDALPLAQSTVSQHLKVLKAAGLVQGEVDGPRVCYCADTKPLLLLVRHLNQLLEESPCRPECT